MRATPDRPGHFPQAFLMAMPLLLAAATACDDGLAPEPEPGTQASAWAGEPGGTAPLQAESQWLVASIRDATAPYHRAGLATAEGFIPVSGCVAAPEVGGMGFHYLDPIRIWDGTVDPSSPEILLYEPRTNGDLRLVGVEFLVVADAWDPEHAGPPTLLGRSFDEHRGEARHGLPFDHYELHVWAWRHNSLGLTAPFNPRVSCTP